MRAPARGPRSSRIAPELSGAERHPRAPDVHRRRAHRYAGRHRHQAVPAKRERRRLDIWSHFLRKTGGHFPENAPVTRCCRSSSASRREMPFAMGDFPSMRMSSSVGCARTAIPSSKRRRPNDLRAAARTKSGNESHRAGIRGNRVPLVATKTGNRRPHFGNRRVAACRKICPNDSVTLRQRRTTKRIAAGDPQGGAPCRLEDDCATRSWRRQRLSLQPG